MSKYVKTGVEIWSEIKKTIDSPKESIKDLSDACFNEYLLKKYLFLPDGLNVLEKMLKDNSKVILEIPYVDLQTIHSVFKEFKKEVVEK